MPTATAYSLARMIQSPKLTGTRRQRLTAISDRYAAGHGLTIDKTFKTKDENPIAQCLQAVRQGIIPPGATFLVESLDEEKNYGDAFKCLLEIINCGHTIVTFPDGTAHDNTSIAANPSSFMISLLNMVEVQHATELRRQIARQTVQSKKPKPPE